MEDLRLSLVQADLHWEEAAANRRAFAKKLAPLEGKTDLVILPEMFTTGFSMRAETLAEPTEGPTLRWMEEQAVRLNAVITGSFIAGEAGRYFNRLIWMRPDATYDSYDKRHLFTLAGEQNHYTAGQVRRTFTCKGWRIRPLICYDLRFPVWSRNTDHYDLLFYIANWPERRGHAWRSLLTARAIENQSYTAGVNRVGNDGNGVYHSGDSSLLDYNGGRHYHCAHREDVFTTTLSYQAQMEFRHKLQFLPDRDDFTISL